MQTEAQIYDTSTSTSESENIQVVLKAPEQEQEQEQEQKEKPKTKAKNKPKSKAKTPVITDEKTRNKTHNEKWNQIVQAIESGDKIAINTPQGDIILCKMTPGKAWALDENGDSIVKGIKLHRSYLKPWINSARKV